METRIISHDIFLITAEADLRGRELFNKLADEINYLIIHDFERLVSTLYRLDINEQKLREVLDNNQATNSADLIARLVIERQIEKARSRKENTPPAPKSSDEELL